MLRIHLLLTQKKRFHFFSVWRGQENPLLNQLVLVELFPPFHEQIPALSENANGEWFSRGKGLKTSGTLKNFLFLFFASFHFSNADRLSRRQPISRFGVKRAKSWRDYDKEITVTAPVNAGEMEFCDRCKPVANECLVAMGGSWRNSVKRGMTIDSFCLFSIFDY